MIVISGTTPIDYLILIKKIDLLRRLYSTVIVPQAVHEEMQHPVAPVEVRAWLEHRPSWLEVRVICTEDASLSLGAGERQTILLAQELRGAIVLIDDGKARREALARGLVVTGTLGILAVAAKRNLIDLPETLRDLRRTNFRVSDELIERLSELDRQR